MSNLYTESWFDQQVIGSIAAAGKIVPFIMERYQPESIVEFGCGIGAWGKEFSEFKGVNYCGIDGSHVNGEKLLFPRRFFISQELNSAAPVGQFDLAISLETAEHLRQETARNFVKALCDSAPRVVFSAAIPNQSGTGHINEQWQSYWASIFSSYGYVPGTEIREAFWGEEEVPWWYLQNILTFEKSNGLINIPKSIDVVHPRAYLYLAAERDQRLQERQWALQEKEMIQKILAKEHKYFWMFGSLMSKLVNILRKFRSRLK